MTWPDDPEHFAVLWGFFESLTHRYTWGEPLTADSELLATLYAQIYDENREHFEGLF